MDFQEFKKQFNATAYDRYRVKMHLEDIAGGVPADPKMIDGWIDASNKAKTDEQRAALKAATVEELGQLAEEKIDKSWCRFKRDEQGPYIEGRCVKSALKECSNIIKSLVKVKNNKGKEEGSRNLKSKVAECVFVEEAKVYLRTQDGAIITGDLPTEERPVHAMTAQGPRTSLKRTDVARDVLIEFTVSLAKTGAVSEAALFSALTYLEKNGLGSDRSQGRGQGEVLDVTKL